MRESEYYDAANLGRVRIANMVLRHCKFRDPQLQKMVKEAQKTISEIENIIYRRVQLEADE